MPSHTLVRALFSRVTVAAALAAVGAAGAVALMVDRGGPPVLGTSAPRTTSTGTSASVSSDSSTGSATLPPAAGDTTRTTTTTDDSTLPTCATYRTAVDPGMFPMSVAHARACPDGAAVEAVGIVLTDADGNLWLCDDHHHIEQPACVDDGLLLVGVRSAPGGTYAGVTYTGVKQGNTMILGASG